jgi:putative transposase
MDPPIPRALLPMIVGGRRMVKVKYRRHSPEQVVRKLREADRMLGEGSDLDAVCRHLEVSQPTYHRWRAQYGGMKADDVKRLKELEHENTRLKRIVADQALDIAALKGRCGGKILSPARRRRAVVMVQEAHGFSERRACKLLGQSRSTQRRQPPAVPDLEQRIRARLRELARQRPRYGHRRMTALLRREGFCANHKRVQRLCRDEGLRVLVRPRKRMRLGTSTAPADRLRAAHPDQVWAIDFCFDQTADLRTLKILAVTDEFTKEAMAIEVDRSIDADHTVAVLETIVASRGRHPEHLRMDNGPELTANALRDWCRFSGARTSYIEPGSPWENPFIESFNGKLRDELLAGEVFETLLEAKVLAEDFRTDYNDYRPHSSLGYLAPSKFAEQWATNQSRLSNEVAP